MTVTSLKLVTVLEVPQQQKKIAQQIAEHVMQGCWIVFYVGELGGDTASPSS